MDDEYIKRDTAINELICAVYWALNQHGNVTGQVIIDKFNAIPIADVQPVVHGKWGKGNMPTYGGYKCSVCGENTLHHKANFCPNCGARMDGK